jgi:hypothetical protein
MSEAPQQTRQIKDLDEKGFEKGQRNWKNVRGHFVYVDQKTSIFVKDGEDEQSKIKQYLEKRKGVKP